MENKPTEQTAATNPPAYSGAALHWLHVLPSTIESADLFALDQENLALKCISAITANKPFEIALKAEHPAETWLNHFYFESRNREKVFGTKNLGIGYPFIMTKLGGYEITAPLFIWQLQMEPDPQHTDKWTLVRTEQNPIFPNYPLFHLLDHLFQSNIYEKTRQLTQNRQLNGNAIESICQEILPKLSLREEGLPLSVQPFPNTETIAELVQKGALKWSAVMGIFPTLPHTTITKPPVIAPQLPADLEWQHPFTQLPLDPAQRQVMHAVQHHALTVVEGASGAGKTYLISAIISNALSNGKKCLVVSKSINALRRAQKFLLEKGFGDLSFILRDLQSDHLMLADMLRMAAENKTKATYNDEHYRTILNRLSREQRKLDDAWEGLNAPFFGNRNFSDTVGAYLEANRKEGKELLLSQINPTEFDFTIEEYEGILNAIKESKPLFMNFPTLNHPLGKLNHAIFTKHAMDQGLQATKHLVHNLLDKATGLHHRFIAKTNEYAESATEHYEQVFTDLDQKTRKVRDGIEDGRNRFGSDFEKPASSVEKLYGVFSDHYKQIHAAKENIGKLFDELRQFHSQHKYFDFDIPNNLDTRNIKKIAELTKDFEATLRVWRRKIPTTVREDVRRLNANSVHPELDFREQVKELEYVMDIFLEEFNEAGLYQEPLKHEMLTIPKRQEFLEELIAKLEDTRFYLRDFPDFYVWHRHWLSLSAIQQNVVKALCKIKPKDWTAAFDSWYLYHFIQAEYHPGLQWSENSLQTYQEEIRELRNLLPFQISALWQNKKNKSLKSLKSENPNGYKVWFGKNNRTLSAPEPVDDLFRNHIQALTDTLPVLMVTPQVALDVVNLSNMLFDVVLVDEAHNIPKQECFHLFDMAKNLVVFGDPKQDMTPFAEDDFLEYCQSLGIPNFQLDYQHQDAPEEWVLFNQIAFDTPVKRLPSGRAARDMTVVSNVEGIYNEKNRTNEAEARQIIDWLNLVEPTPAKTYPVVGIACATVQQRNLIASQLLQIRQKKLPGHEKIQQLHLNGLGVYQFAELQGQHVDVLMLSITHGLVDNNGVLTRHLHFWNTQLGLNQLYVALTRATRKLFIAHSIPPGLHTVLAADRNFVGTCILSHLASFAEFIQQGDYPAAQEQLLHLKSLLNREDFRFKENLFRKEVVDALSSYFEPAHIHQNAILKGVKVPAWIGPDQHGTPCVLQMNGVLTHSPLPSYEWEAKVCQYFAQRQVHCTPVYAVQWWKSARQEARKLAGKILRPEIADNETRDLTENIPETQKNAAE